MLKLGQMLNAQDRKVINSIDEQQVSPLVIWDTERGDPQDPQPEVPVRDTVKPRPTDLAIYAKALPAFP